MQVQRRAAVFDLVALDQLIVRPGGLWKPRWLFQRRFGRAWQITFSARMTNLVKVPEYASAASNAKPCALQAGSARA